MKDSLLVTKWIKVYTLILVVMTLIDISQTKNITRSSRLYRRQQRRSASASLDTTRSRHSDNEISADTVRRRHSRRKVPTLSKLQRQLNATNTTEPGYATVYKLQGELPRYECSDSEWACPYPRHHLVTCIALEKLCDYSIDCPNAEDEDPVQCSFYRATQKSAHKSLEQQQTLLDKLERQQRLLEDMVEKFTHIECEMESTRDRINHHRHDNSLVHIDSVDDMCSDYAVDLNNHDIH